MKKSPSLVLVTGNYYRVEERYPGVISLDAGGQYWLEYLGLRFKIIGIANVPDGSKAALTLGGVGSRKKVAIFPSPQKLRE
jgi:hypothetical protein